MNITLMYTQWTFLLRFIWLIRNSLFPQISFRHMHFLVCTTRVREIMSCERYKIIVFTNINTNHRWQSSCFLRWPQKLSRDLQGCKWYNTAIVEMLMRFLVSFIQYTPNKFYMFQFCEFLFLAYRWYHFTTNSMWYVWYHQIIASFVKNLLNWLIIKLFNIEIQITFGYIR